MSNLERLIRSLDTKETGSAGRLVLLLSALGSLAYSLSELPKFVSDWLLGLSPGSFEPDVGWLVFAALLFWSYFQFRRQSESRYLWLFISIFVVIQWFSNRLARAIDDKMIDWLWSSDDWPQRLASIFNLHQLLPILLGLVATLAAYRVVLEPRRAEVAAGEATTRTVSQFRWSLILVGLVLLQVTRHVPDVLWLDITGLLPDSTEETLARKLVGRIYFSATSPMLLAAAFVLWLRTAAVTVTGSGVRLTLLNDAITVLHAKWNRAKWMRVAARPGCRRTLVIAYTGRFGLPLTLALDEAAYDGGPKTVDAILGEAAERGIEVRQTYSGNWAWVTGWILIAGGAGLTIWSHFATNNAWYPLIEDPDYSFSRFRDAAAVIPLSALSLSTAASFSLGLGLLSAYHRGGPAWPVAWLWVWQSMNVSSPIFHWLVWNAVFAIHTAFLSPVLPPQPVATGPTQLEWMIGIGLVQALPLAALLFYLVGIAIGRRETRTT